MAKLSDLIDVSVNQATIKIQGVDIPIHLGFDAFEYIAEAYGSSYTIFEKQMNIMLKQKVIQLNKSTLKLVWALIYGMIRAGGTETTVEELKAAVPFGDLQGIFDKAITIFTQQNFQATDQEKIVQDPKK